MKKLWVETPCESHGWYPSESPEIHVKLCGGGARKRVRVVEVLVDVVGHRPGEPKLKVHFQGPVAIVDVEPM